MIFLELYPSFDGVMIVDYDGKLYPSHYESK